MAWFAIVEDATGRLVSVGSVVASRLPPGVVSQEIPSRPNWNATRWDEAAYVSTKDATAALVPRTRPAKIDRVDEIVADARIAAAVGRLNPAQLDALRTVVGEVLGGERYREANESAIVNPGADGESP